MPKATKNDVANVSGGKGVAGGYLFRAPLGTAKPTGLDSKLDEAFEVCGFVSEDGIVFATETDAEELVDMNGETMETSKTKHSETMTVTFAEVKEGTLAVQYGGKNVADADGVITVHVNGDEPDHWIYVFEGVLKNGRRWRRLIHDGKVTEMGDLTVASSELMGREATVTAYKDPETGDYYTDWIESTETEKASEAAAKAAGRKAGAKKEAQDA